MIVPDCWAEARRQHRASGRQVTIRRLGWSTTSAADATAMAERRADEALARVLAGEPLERRERKGAYPTAVGVPIREEVLERHGESVITRNSYGARCLNTPDALFADVDFEPTDSGSASFLIFLLLAAISVAIGLFVGHWAVGAALVALSAVLAPVLAGRSRRQREAKSVGIEAHARQKLAAFLTRHPDWNVRVYRTPAGLRLLARHRPCGPAEPEVRNFFQAVGADPVYAQMCLNQQCFRARLTAKPWRIGIETRLRPWPWPGLWPEKSARVRERAAWITQYDAKAAAFGACRYVESVGSGIVHDRLHPVIDLHDQLSRANDASVVIA